MHPFGVALHQPDDTLSADEHVMCPQLGVHARTAVCAPAALVRFADERFYVSRGLDGTSPLAALLAGQPLSSAASRLLRAEFRTDPIKHSRFAYSTVIDALDPDDWSSLSTLAMKTQDPAVFANVFNAAYSKGRAQDRSGVLSGRPEPLLRSAAAQTFESDFLTAAGISP